MSKRARDLGIPFEGQTGQHNAITDVHGVAVGHTTLISGEGALVRGMGPIRTGVTTILPRGRSAEAVFAGWFSLNGNGEMTGTTWIEDSGFMGGPLAITNTHSVGVVRDAIIEWTVENALYDKLNSGDYWGLPVVGETYDGMMNDINGFHVKKSHVFAALDSAETGHVPEGCVGGGTGMMCHGFKGGIGTASRLVQIGDAGYTLGVLVQANYGARHHLQIAGVPVGRHITDLQPIFNKRPPPTAGTGSIIAIAATDAPLLPHQLKRVARRISLGIARVGGMGANTSGDIFLAFSTANAGAAHRSKLQTVEMLPNDQITPLFEATAFATEEAIINALVAADTMTGINDNTIFALPHDQVQEVLRQYNRLGVVQFGEK